MKFNYSLSNLIFCAALYNIKVAFKAVYGMPYDNTLCGDVNTRLPVILIFNSEKPTAQYNYYETENKEIIRYEAKCNFAFQSVVIMPSKFADRSERQDLYEAESPSKRAYRVIGTREGLGRRIEIHLLNGEIISLVRSPSSTKYVREPEEGFKSEDDLRKEQLAARKALLYSLLIILIIVLIVVVVIGTIFFCRKRRMESRSLNREDTAI